MRVELLERKITTAEILEAARQFKNLAGFLAHMNALNSQCNGQIVSILEFSGGRNVFDYEIELAGAGAMIEGVIRFIYTVYAKTDP